MLLILIRNKIILYVYVNYLIKVYFLVIVIVSEFDLVLLLLLSLDEFVV